MKARAAGRLRGRVACHGRLNTRRGGASLTMNYPHPILAKEGWPFIALSLIAAVAVHFWAGWLWALPLWIVAAFVVQFFRDPPRTAPDDPDAVVSPADGRIVVVEKTRDPYLDRDAIK